MSFRIVAFLISTTILAACSGGGSGGGSSTSPAVEGLDLSGTWRFAGVECYDSSLQNLTALATPTSDSSVGTAVIDRNQITSQSIGTGTCNVTTQGSFTANLESGTSESGYGTGVFGATTASVIPASACTTTTSFNMDQGTISPATLNSTYSDSQVTPQRTFEFVINPPYLGFTSLIQVVGRPTDICFLIYQKL